MIGALETLQLLCTAGMAAIIWHVQCVHYPSFHEVDPSLWRAFHRRHTGMTTRIVGPLMLGECFAALGLLALSSEWRSGWPGWCGLGLLALIWTSTVFVQIPLHLRLERGHDLEAIDRLVASNWIRCFSWTLRVFCVLCGP